MTEAENSLAICVLDRRMLRIGERQRTLLKCYSGQSEAILDRVNDASDAPSIRLSAPSLSAAQQQQANRWQTVAQSP